MDGSEMRGIRKSLGMRQAEFAQAICRSMPQVCRYEKGRKPIPDELAITVKGLVK